MTRHFLGLYLIIILTLAVVSWAQDRLLQTYGKADPTETGPVAVAMAAIAGELREIPPARWKQRIAGIAGESGIDMELFATQDVAGRATLARLSRGDIAFMGAASGDTWALKQLDAQHILAVKHIQPAARRGALEWTLTMLFYALIALVLMIWIWPLTRDLRALEKAVAGFGNRSWVFGADIKPHSQIYPLAATFRRMAARIDGLIESHKDLSNAVSHEIKTPLARMQFEIELAQQATSLAEVGDSLGHIKADIDVIDDLVRATLAYAILERADMALNLGRHNFATLIPAIAEAARRDAPPGIDIGCQIQSDAQWVVCDLHLLESVLKNLIYNATRYAKRKVSLAFQVRSGVYELRVDDDGPGIPEKDRERVFESFVQLEPAGARKSGFGLGLAIVRRAIEWHDGKVSVSESPCGGARVLATWPVKSLSRASERESVTALVNQVEH
ncbi:MAG TPA: ATP-binding protein [Steroidobacteraceae bacterium]|nr:ATP-binding protein [Steroidobacteraceae bacterium]